MISCAPSFHGYRFPSGIIAHAVWLYFRFSLSCRDVEDLLTQRGITVTYWCNRGGTGAPQCAFLGSCCNAKAAYPAG